MGENKLTLKIGATTLLDRVHGALASHCEDIVVVGARGYVPAGTRRAFDLRLGKGPLAGIEAGLLAARHRPVFVAAGDMPFLSSNLVEYLLGLLSDDVSAVVPHWGGKPRALCTVYGREVGATVSAALDGDVRSIHKVIEGLPSVHYVGEEELWRFGDPELLLMNIDTPDDLAQARAIIHEGVHHGVREATSPALPDSLFGQLRALLWLYRGKSVFPQDKIRDETEAAVVLGTQVLFGKRVSGMLQAHRVRHAAQLYAKGKVGRLILTDGSKHPASVAEVVARTLRKMGVSEESILVEREAQSTRESARLVALRAREQGIRSVVVVTDPLHCVRAVEAFRAEGLSTRASPVYRSPMWWVLKRRREQFLREIVAVIWYRIRRRVESRFRR